MDKLKMETPNLTEQNIDRIAELFPGVITEKRDENGKLTRAVNFELLKQQLSPEVLAGDEAYEFTWVGKKASIVEANRPIRKTLRPCKEESKDWDTTENLYIEGDNLDVLKLLQESYLGKVKMIYIDPPYNTGHDFIYNDRFEMDEEEYNQQIGLFDEEQNKNFRENNESNPRFHSDWCSMMFSRLNLALRLLSDDGVLFISIDDNELVNLRRICDEVFGESNFIATLIWEKTRKNDARFISSGHEYMVIYAKSVQYLRDTNTYWREDKPGADDIHHEYEKLSSLFGDDYSAMEVQLKDFYDKLPKDHPAKKLSRYNKIDEKGVWRDDNMSWPGGDGPSYDVLHPVTGKPCVVPPGGWRFSTPEKMQEMISSGIVVFREDHTQPPIRKTYLVRRIGKNATDEENGLGKQVMGSYFYRSYLQSSDNIKKLMGKGVFEYPKDHEVLLRMIKYVTSDNDVILDFFSGSSSTAHAVMQLNAEDGGHRKFIMVQLPEPCDEKSEAYKAGYKNICEIGKERIRRAGAKIKSEAGLMAQNLDTGFRVFKLDETNMKDVFYSAEEYTQTLLDDMISNIKEDRTDLDLLYGCLLEWGLPLSLPHVTEEIEGCHVHTVNGGDLIACFDEDIPESVIKKIAERKPLRVVFRDSSFASSPEKINVTEIFKLAGLREQDVKVI